MRIAAISRDIFIKVFVLPLGLVFALWHPAPVEAALTLSAEVSADPAEPGEAVLVKVTVTNTDSFDRTGVSVQMDYPAELEPLQDGFISDGGDCDSLVGSSFFCNFGEVLTWDLGTLPANTGVTVSLPPLVGAAIPAGTVIQFAPSATDDGGTVVVASESVEVVGDRVLELSLSELSLDPVVPGGTLTYSLTYGHSALSAVAPGTVLELPVPAGLTFVSASDDGVLVGGLVRWTLGTLNPGDGGERRASFEVDSGLSLGSVIKAEAVVQDLGGQLSRADAVTRVEAAVPLTVTIDANANPAEAGKALNVEFTVTNSSSFERSGVTLSLRYPVGLEPVQDGLISDGGDCVSVISSSFFCDPREELSWDLGTLAAGTGVTVSLPPLVSAALAAGSIIELTAQVRDNFAGVTAQASETILVALDRNLELSLSELSLDPVVPGGTLTYSLTYGHSALSAVAPDTVLELPVPAGLTFVSASDGGALVSDSVQWTLGTLNPGDGGERRASFEVDSGLSLGSAIKAEAVVQDSGGQLSRADAVTRVEAAVPLTVTIDANANPAEAGEALSVELTVTNSSSFERSGVTLSLRYPVGLEPVQDGLISDGGDCVSVISSSFFCDPREELSWDLGTLAAGTGVTVSLPPLVSAALAAGSIIELKAQVRDNFADVTAQASETILVALDRTLELSISELVPDPVVPGTLLAYSLTYGHSALSAVAPGALLELPVPSGLTFVAATGGGTVADGKVLWSLGDLNPGQGGERIALFWVDAGLDLGTTIKAEAVVGDDNGQLTRSDTVTRLETSVPLTVTIQPDVANALPGATLSVDLTVTNLSAFERSDVKLVLRYAVGLDPLQDLSISDGGDCTNVIGSSFQCNAREEVIWNFATIPPSSGITVNLPPTISASLAQGNVIEFVAYTQDSTARSRAMKVVRVGPEEPPAAERVGGSVFGMSPGLAVCQNLSTAQTVLVTFSSLTPWDCEVVGLLVSPGDVVRLWYVNRAPGGSAPFGGTVTGVNLLLAACSNLTTGQSVLVDPNGSTYWDCRAAGLAVTVPDLLLMQAIGTVK